MSTASGKEELLPVEGIFVEIGLLPNTGWLGNTLDMNEVRQVKVDPRTHKTSHLAGGGNQAIGSGGDASRVEEQVKNIAHSSLPNLECPLRAVSFR